MRRTRANDCWTLPFDVATCYAALLDFESYPQWWPAELRVRVLKSTPDHVGSRVEIGPFGGRFVCEGTGRWTLETVEGGTRLCYQVFLEPQGWLVRLDFAAMHPKGMAKVFEGLEAWLRRQNSRQCIKRQ